MGYQGEIDINLEAAVYTLKHLGGLLSQNLLIPHWSKAQKEVVNLGLLPSTCI
jgi:hypothetical protein